MIQFPLLDASLIQLKLLDQGKKTGDHLAAIALSPGLTLVLVCGAAILAGAAVRFGCSFSTYLYEIRKE